MDVSSDLLKTEVLVMEKLMSVLESVSVINKDNGSVFTNTERLDAIASLLSGSAYKKQDASGLFHLYAKKPVDEIQGPVLIISSHVDCETNITRCFVRMEDQDTLLGTFDNAITNASAVYLMLAGNLPDNVLFAFTGDEEEDGRGARDLIRFIRRNRLNVRNIFVLDVTEEGWAAGAAFTVENDFWDDDFGKKISGLAEQTGYKWKFVPEDPDDIPSYIPEKRVIHMEAYEDESWEYDEEDLPCFSFCLPTRGEMHSNRGILARVISFRRYTEVLELMLQRLS